MTSNQVELATVPLQTIANAIPDLFAALDLEFRLIACNTAYVNEFKETFGQTVAPGLNLLDVLALQPQVQADARQLWERALGGETFTTRRTFEAETGRRNSYEIRFSPLHDDRGMLVGAMHLVRNITPLLRAEWERDNFFELSQDLLAVVGLDGYFKRLNPTWETILGYSRAELGRRPLLDFIHPEDQAASIEQARRLAAGLPMPLFENRFRDKDGSYHWLAWSATPVIEEGLLYCTARDVTRHKEAESMRLALTAGQVGTWEIDLATRLVKRSPSVDKIFGLPPETGPRPTQDYWACVHPDDVERIRADGLEAIKNRREHLSEYRLIRPDGQTRWVAVRGNVLLDERGRPDRMLGVVVDMTARKEAEEGLRRSEARLRRLNDSLEQRVAGRTADLKRIIQDLDQFAYAASHDLKAPLRAIDNLSTWITEDSGEKLPESSRIHLVQMQRRIKRMESLLTDLLAYSRAGRNYGKIEVVNTARLVQEIIVVLAPPLAFTFEITDSLPTISTVQIALEVVLRNLLDNAVKHHHRPDGRVVISAETEQSWVTFSVADDGPGIGEAYRDRIFQAFQTLQPRDKVEGSGMGLAIVKRIVENQGGRIHLISKPEQGTTFRFTWPGRSKNDL